MAEAAKASGHDRCHGFETGPGQVFLFYYFCKVLLFYFANSRKNVSKRFCEYSKIKNGYNMAKISINMQFLTSSLGNALMAEPVERRIHEQI